MRGFLLLVTASAALAASAAAQTLDEHQLGAQTGRVDTRAGADKAGDDREPGQRTSAEARKTEPAPGADMRQTGPFSGQGSVTFQSGGPVSQSLNVLVGTVQANRIGS